MTKSLLRVVWMWWMVVGLVPVLMAQGNGGWALKIGAGGVFTRQLSVEGEVHLKGRWNVALRGAVVRPNLDSLRGPVEGFFFKAGPKWYLTEEGAAGLRGFSLKPEVVVGHYRDWDTNVRGNFGNRWVNSYGLTGNVCYNVLLWDRVVIEGNLGAGYVAQYESLVLVGDQPPFDEWRTPYDRVYADERSGNEHSQWSIAGRVCVNAALMLGVKF